MTLVNIDFLILLLVSKKPMHAKELVDEITKRKGEKHNLGTIYPAIMNLSEAGFLDGEKGGKTSAYNITPSGKKALTVAKRKTYEIFLHALP